MFQCEGDTPAHTYLHNVIERLVGTMVYYIFVYVKHHLNTLNQNVSAVIEQLYINCNLDCMT